MSAFERKTQESVNAEWNAMAGDWDDMAAGYRDSFVKMLWEETSLNASDERVVLDFGCGTGLLTEALRRLSPESKFICVDAADAMVGQVKTKIKAGDWDNVQAYSLALANYESADEKTRTDLDSLKGKVDLVVASSVINFVPSADVSETMKVIGELLKPGGLFCHSDWRKGDEDPDGCDSEKARKLYGMAGLEIKSTNDTSTFCMGSHGEVKVFVGVARKP
jgi:SAM-dependent methyltransferase